MNLMEVYCYWFEGGDSIVIGLKGGDHGNSQGN